MLIQISSTHIDKYVIICYIIQEVKVLKKSKLMKFLKKSLVWYIILCVVFIIATIGFCFASLHYNDNLWFLLAKDVSVIIASTFAVSLLIGLLIEKNSKEDFYTELVKDTILSSTFEDRLSDEEKDTICKNIFKSLRCQHNDALYNIYASFENRFVKEEFLKDEFYFEECEYHITCSVKEDCIEKNFIKTLKIRPYSSKCSLNNFKLGTYHNKYFGDKKSFEIKSLTINGNTISDADLKNRVVMNETVPNKRSLLDAKAGYTRKIECVYNSKITLSSTTQTTISYNYITRTDLSDNYLTIRSSRPSRNFKVDFCLKNNDYAAQAVGFGFIDKAQKSPNSNEIQEVNVRFDDWVLPEDGVVIMINKI